MHPPFVRSPYNYDTDQASAESGLLCEDLSLAQQQFRDECDINMIVRRFGVTGELPTTAAMPSYGDFSGITDYREALDAVRAAEASFMALPARTRARFENDPQQLLEFLAVDANRPEAVELGLIPKPAIPDGAFNGVPEAAPVPRAGAQPLSS